MNPNTTEPIFDLLPLNWQFFSTVGTLSAVIIVLSLYLLPRRRKIKVFLSNTGRYSSEPRAFINIANPNFLPVTITRVVYRNPSNQVIELSHQNFKLPETIEYGHSISLESPAIAHNLSEFRAIFVEDAFGKRWRCNRMSVRYTKKLFRNFIGKRFIYPSMGDETDEKKIK